jgi:hypothetical protein
MAKNVTTSATAQALHIGSVTFSPANPRSGESVKVEVQAGSPNASLEVTINGVPGDVQYLVWERPGKKRLFIVAATADGQVLERRTETIELRPNTSGYPKLRIERLLESPTTVLFSVDMGGQQRRGTTGTLNPFKGVRQAELGRVKGIGQSKSQVGLNTAPPVFEWDFGKGFMVGTKMGAFAHDFGPDLSPSAVRQNFHVAVRVIKGTQPPIEIRRTISVVNTYAIAKRRGFLQPRVVHQDLNARFMSGAFEGEVTVWNPEAFDITLNTRRLEAFFANARRTSVMYPPQPTHQTIEAGTETTFTARVPASQIGEDVVGFALHCGGVANRLPARVSVYFDIPSRWWHASELVPQDLQAILRSVIVRKMTPNPRQITARTLQDLVRRGEVKLLSREPSTSQDSMRRGATATRRAEHSLRKPLSGHTDPPAALEGAECDPMNLPDDIPENLVCQATSETRFVPMPGRFMNAKKGDAILSPGGTGLIGGLLRQVHPPQNYSHSGIMTRNQDELTHSTASEDRLLDYPVGSFLGTPAPTDGHRADVLKYLWPGVITQAVADTFTLEGTVHGEPFPDPESGKSYTISGFDPNNKKLADSGEVIPPAVVKPDPFIETVELRSQLRDAADIAIDQEGKGHYRFYCYTDPTIGLDQTAPTDAGWAGGTIPSVCSSFIWMCLRQAGFSFEGGEMENADKEMGAEFGADSEDGLYNYTAEERLTAGEWLYGELYDMVVETADIAGPEGLITAFTDMPDDVANQILNTFASDWADTDAKDSEAWKTAVDARAVSPDNMLFWDSPEKGGPYGYVEPLEYRPPRYELVTVHRWKKALYTGTLTGLVRFKGKPVAGAQAMLYDQKFAPTGADGRFELTDVFAGNYILSVSKSLEGMYLSASVPVTVKKDEETDVTVDLQPPDDLYRAVTIDGEMLTLDDEYTLDAKQILANPHSYKSLFAVLRVGPFDTHDETTFSDVVDGDVRSEFHIEADWHLDKSVTLNFTLRIFETADPADGIDGEVSASFTVSAGGTGVWEGMKVYNDDEDFAVVEFSAKNDVQTA